MQIPDRPITVKKPKLPKRVKLGSISSGPMSIEQFRSYLQGIMFVGGPSWCPDRTQWEAIVQIIDQLILSQPVLPTTVPAQTQTWNADNYTHPPQFQPAPITIVNNSPPQSGLQMDVNSSSEQYVSPFI